MDKGLGAFIDFLKQITKSNQNGNKGSEFENFIRSKLDTCGFKEASFDEKSYMYMNKNIFKIEKEEFDNLKRNLKEKVLNKNNIQVIKNPFKDYKNNDIYIYINHLVNKISLIF